MQSVDIDTVAWFVISSDTKESFFLVSLHVSCQGLNGSMSL